MGSKRGAVVPGAVFGRLTVIKRLRKNNRYVGKVKCQCSCGNISFHRIDGLVYGIVKSCGCLNNEKRGARSIARGKYKEFPTKYPRTYKAWKFMLGRCYSKRAITYKDYGALGVFVCEGLKEHPKNIVKVIGPAKKPLYGRTSVDRFPIHDGNYTCGQCQECNDNGWKKNIRWADKQEQMLNRGDFNVYLTAFGKTLTRSQWHELSGVHAETVRKRMLRGWSLERALITPDKYGNCYKPSTEVKQ